MAPDCSYCYLPIDGRVIRDHGDPWCEACLQLQLRIEAKAAANADRYIKQDVAQAGVLCEIQRGQVAA